MLRRKQMSKNSARLMPEIAAVDREMKEKERLAAQYKWEEERRLEEMNMLAEKYGVQGNPKLRRCYELSKGLCKRDYDSYELDYIFRELSYLIR
jgi:hypothetical protein